MRPHLATLAALLALALAACSVPAIVMVPIDGIEYTISSQRVMVPEQLRDPSTNTIRRIPCMNDMQCPSLGAGQPAVRCVAGACDPDAFSFSLDTDVIDLNANASVQRYGSTITLIEVRQAQYTATARGLRNPVGPTEILWGPDTAATVDAEGVRLFGTIPEIDLAGSDTAAGDIQIDAAGSAALSDYLVRTSRRMRLFARPRLDIAPGSPIPTGDLVLRLNLTVRVEAQLVR